MSEVITKETIQRMRDYMREQQVEPRPCQPFIFGGTEARCRELAAAFGVEYAPIDGRQLIGDTLMVVDPVPLPTGQSFDASIK